MHAHSHDPRDAACRRIAAPRRSRLRARSFLPGILLWLAITAAVIPAAQAAVISATVQTGTPLAPTGSTPLCPLDPATADLNVCTNDTLIYSIEYVTSGGDASISIASTLPKCSPATTPGCPADGIIATWGALPLQCNGAGSGVSADGLTLTCNVNGPVSAGTARILPIVNIDPDAPDGATLPSPVTTVTSPQTPVPIVPAPLSGPVTVQAQAAFDLVKAPQNENSRGLQFAKGPDGVTDGWVMNVSAAIRVPGGFRGIEALDANGVTWDDVLGDITVAGTNTAGVASAAAVQAAIRASAIPFPVSTPGGPNACFDNGVDGLQYRYGQSLPRGRDGPAAGPLFDRLYTSGTCTLTQSGGPGGPVSVRITGARWNNTFYPTHSFLGNPLPAEDKYVSAKVITFWFPATVFDTAVSGAQFAITNTYSNVRGTSVSGQAVVQPNTVNDATVISFLYSLSGSTSKRWVNYNSANDLQISGTYTQDGVVVDGMPAHGRPSLTNNGVVPLSGAILCDKLDNSKFHLFADAYATGTSGSPALAPGEYVIEYGTGGIDGAGAGWASRDDHARANCADNQSPAWYTRRADVPGGDIAITKVRLRFLRALLPAQGYMLWLPVRMTATSPVAAMGVSAGHVWPQGTRISNWSSETYSGASFTGVYNTPDTTPGPTLGQAWGAGGTGSNAYTPTGLAQRGRGDTLTFVGASATVVKETSSPADTATQILPGATVDYVLRPILSSAVGTTQTTSMTVRDVLPPGLSYVAGSASIAPDSIQANVPEAGYTTLVWNLGSLPIGQTITPITLQALVDPTLPNGTYVPNFTVVSSPADVRACATSGGAYDGILNPGYSVLADGNVTGTLCLHAARRDLRVSNPGGFQVNKVATTPQVEPGRPVGYSLRWISVGSDLDSTDLIDILPYNGDGRGTNFSGTATLAGALGPVTGDATPASTLYYSSAAPASINPDPSHASNALPGGSTRWCTAVEIGSAGCPTSFAQATAIRVVSNSMQADNALRSLAVTLNPVGNVTSDVYNNNFGIRGVSGGAPLLALVNSSMAQAVVVDGSLSGRVFRDDDDDGVIDAVEVGIGGVSVTLEGCSSGPDGSVQTAAIAMAGVPACAGDDVPVAMTVTTAGDGTYAFDAVLSGIYRVTEAQPAGFDDGRRAVGTVDGSASGNANAVGTVPSVITDIVMPLQAVAIRYDFGERFQSPRLTLVKTVTNDSGGSAAVGDFVLTAAGPSTITGTSGQASVTDAAVPPGTYVLSETNLPGYVAGDYSCVLNGAVAVSGNSIRLSGGDQAVCTINNDDQGATLTLVKTVTNDNGGTATAGDFVLSAAGPTTISGASGASAVTNAPVGAGSYTLSEANLPGYAAGTYRCVINGGAAAVGNSLTLAGGDVATCTIHNDDVGATLTLIKTVTNGNGGSATPSDFTLSASGPTPISGTTGAASVTGAAVHAGTYALSETNLPGYVAGAYSCTINGGAAVVGDSVTLAGGDAATCTINNTDQPVSLTLVKQVINDHGGTATTADFTLTASGPVTISGISGAPTVTQAPVSEGRYTLSEAGRAGYASGGWSCSGGSLAGTTLTLARGDNVICTIVNDDEGAILTLVKQVVNDGGGTATATDFTLSATGPTSISGVTGGAAITNARVQPGRYTLGEDSVPGYVASDYSCAVNGGTAISGNTLLLENGDVAVCTVVNDDTGATLTLIKHVINDDGGTAQVGDFALTASGPTSITGTTGEASITAVPVSAGTYTLSETNLAGYTARDWSCTVNGAAAVIGARLDLAGGDRATCTLVNDDEPAVLSVSKDVVGVAEPVIGSVDRFVVRYSIAVRHVSGGAGTYTLMDTPQFDSDVRVQSARWTRGDEPAQALPPAGVPWSLATDRVLAIGATEVYQLEVQVQVAPGSATTNDRCDAGPGHGLFNLAVLRVGAVSQEDDACADTPVPVTTARLTIEKRGSVRQAELGDLVSYTLRVRNTGDGVAVRPVIVDRLPAGFRLVGGEVRVRGATLVSLEGAPGPELRITLDRIDPGAEVTLAYRVRIGVGALEGDGINRAHAECRALAAATTTQACSNEDAWEVDVTAGVFSDEGGLLGQIFVDCNFNAVKDPEELGIPGVRLYLQDGTYLVSDVEGKYSYWGLRPTTHVLKVDARTLPTRSRLVTSSPQNAGDAQSLFIDLKKGELHRADFIEGSCNNEVIEQVKARRAQGEIRSVQTETGQPSLKLDAKPQPQANPPQQGTDSADQVIERMRHKP